MRSRSSLLLSAAVLLLLVLPASAFAGKILPPLDAAGWINTKGPLTAEDLRGKIVLFDFWASDWNPMTPKQELKLITDRLRVARKGIILFHDPKVRTAAMLPAFLHYLRDNDYHVVHVVSVARSADGAH